VKVAMNKLRLMTMQIVDQTNIIMRLSNPLVPLSKKEDSMYLFQLETEMMMTARDMTKVETCTKRIQVFKELMNREGLKTITNHRQPMKRSMARRRKKQVLKAWINGQSAIASGATIGITTDCCTPGQCNTKDHLHNTRPSYRLFCEHFKVRYTR